MVLNFLVENVLENEILFMIWLLYANSWVQTIVDRSNILFTLKYIGLIEWAFNRVNCVCGI